MKVVVVVGFLDGSFLFISIFMHFKFILIQKKVCARIDRI